MIKIYKHDIASVFLASLLMLTIIDIFLSFHLVKGSSMLPILLEKNWIISNNLAYGIRLNGKEKYILLWVTPKKNDIIIIKDPITNKISVKKIFAIPGENFIKLQKNIIRVANLNFNIDEKHLQKLQNTSIPNNYYLVIGENRQVSLDSRDYGFIDINNIVGKIIYRL
ncbi:signal peptidase I [Candidatus Borreliella tachyglossi]|uniref:Signal peptidase I n=1 Tax=Candidatus Borreliella tachyglossi TaxID=1964448 RepID=A0A2S1LWI5_9SPIR|nr:signal peptidase I [Candidatus Borreliella tachyglossi]AWG42654.1 signal peptidase I [Candidatus Borreliella tachyglossi]